MSTIGEPSAATSAFEKHIQAQFAKACASVGKQLAAQVLKAFEQGKIPANELYALVNMIRQCGHTSNPICDQLMHAYYNAVGAPTSGTREQSWWEPAELG